MAVSYKRELILKILLGCLTINVYADPSFQPTLGSIEIIEGNDYNFGFDYEVSISDCYYSSSDINISGHFIVSQFHQEFNLAGNKKIKQFGNLCGISISTVDDILPKKWTITAYDFIAEKNFTEEVFINFYYRATASIGRIEVVSAATYYQHVITEGIKLKKCSIEVNNVTVDLDVNSQKISIPDSIKDTTELKSRISSYGKGKCGYQLKNAMISDSERRTFLLTDAENKIYKSEVFVKTVNPKQYSNSSLEVQIGDSVIIPCEFMEDVRYCRLYSPNGNLVMEGQTECYHNIRLVTMEHFGDWKCEVGHEHGMEAYEVMVRLIQKDPNSSVKDMVTVEEKSNSFTIYCKVLDKSVLNHCNVIRPDKKVFIIQPGFATERYSTVSSDWEAGICAIEIPKPLQQNEMGPWQCQIDSTPSGAIGGIVNLEKQTVGDFTKYSRIVADVNETIEINCKVPFPTSYCFIKSPQGVKYGTSNILKMKIGECSTEVKIMEGDNGNWTCIFSQENGLPDVETKVEVMSLRVMNIVNMIYANAEVTEGETAELICNTGHFPLAHCNFVTPSGVSYHLKKGSSSSNLYKYTGRGLEYGDCGIEISTATASEDGKWTCTVTLTNSDEEGRPIELIRSPILNVTSYPALGTSLGIGLGVLAGSVLVGVLAFLTWKKRRNSRRNNASTDNRRNSNHSGDIIIIEPVQSYSTVSH